MAFDYKHGGVVTSKRQLEGIAPGRQLEAIDVAEPFDYMFGSLATDANAKLPTDDHAAMRQNLKALGAAMVDDDAPAGDAGMPPVYTYLGQFIDHDITVTTSDNAALIDITGDVEPIDPSTAKSEIRNGRRAIFDLDSVYGDGPTFPGEAGPDTEAKDFYDGPKLKIGTFVDKGAGETGGNFPGDQIPPVADLNRDLPRNANREPLIGDRRNDENTVIAQLHTGFMRFHNALVDHVASNPTTAPEPPVSGKVACGYGYYHQPDDGGDGGGGDGNPGDGASDDRKLFEDAAKLARWHHQWITLHDYLKKVGKASVVDAVIANGPQHYNPTGPTPFMPFEHAVAAYRFGHSMVRHEYDFNRNFNFDAPLKATFEELFRFTGKGGFRGANRLPFNWVIEWDRFVDPSSGPNRAARKIDTRLASDLGAMANEVEEGSMQPDDIKALLMHLAQRNLLRGYMMSIPTGQAMANAMGVAPLTADELKDGNPPAMTAALEAGGFLDRTPAWYYILKEAEIREGGATLGDVGTTIVAETFVGLLKADPNSILNAGSGWTPSDGVGVETVADMLAFAGVLNATS